MPTAVLSCACITSDVAQRFCSLIRWPCLYGTVLRLLSLFPIRAESMLRAYFSAYEQQEGPQQAAAGLTASIVDETT